MFGDVGEGMLGRLGDVAGFWDSPFMLAVRWEEAARAAAEGSRLELSDIGLCSGMDCWMWVGELLFGVAPRKRRLVLNFRDRLLPLFSIGICDDDGDIMSSWCCRSGLFEGKGSGCSRSFAMRKIGRSSSLSLRYSSVTRLISASICTTRSSRSLIE